MKLHKSIAALPFALFLSSCASTIDIPDLGSLYNESAQYHGVDRNPVIVIPGIMGSRLVNPDDGVVVWGAFRGKAVDPRNPEGANVTALPMKPGVPLADLQDQLIVDGALESLDISLFKVPVMLKAYAEILASLGAGGYRDEEMGGGVSYGDDHFTCFQFAYDWRRSNVENAAKLKEFILEKKAYVEAEMSKRYGVKAPNVKFDIVAHSMGGLVSRYFLRYGDQPLPADGSLPALTWEGAELVDSLFMVGTPNGGSVHANLQLHEGLIKTGIVSFQPAMVGTFPAIYELMHRERQGALIDEQENWLDPFDVNNWDTYQWGMLHPDQDKYLAWLLPEAKDATERRSIARDHVEKTLKHAKQLHAALDKPAAKPEGLTIELFAGDAIQMPAVIQAVGPGKGLRVTSYAPGDGTVLRSSALLDERVGHSWKPRAQTPIDFDHITFLFNNHIGLTKDPIFTDNLLHRLLDYPVFIGEKSDR